MTDKKCLMQSELLEAVRICPNCVTAQAEVALAAAKEAKRRSVDRVLTMSRGSSHNACVCFEYALVSRDASMTVSHLMPIVATYLDAKADLSHTLCVVVSQSGGSPDTLMMTEWAKRNGGLTVAVTNNCQSPICKVADFHLYMDAGEEKAVAATKTFSAEVASLALLADALVAVEECGVDADLTSLKQVKNSLLSSVGELGDTLQALSQEHVEVPKEWLGIDGGVIVLSRGGLQGVALECSLKLMESCYKFAYSGSVNEFQHGPKALMSDSSAAILLAPSGEYAELYIKTADLLHQNGCYLVAFSDIDAVLNKADFKVKMPPMSNAIAPLCYTLKMQQVICAYALALGRNPDAPRNLSKVTITE